MKHTSIYTHPNGSYWEATAIYQAFWERTSPSEPFQKENSGDYSDAEERFLDEVQDHINQGYVLDRSGWTTDDTPNVFADFREKVTAKYQHIKAHPEVFFTHFLFHPPATPEAIAQQEERLGFPLPKDLKDFYQITNGFTFRWLHKQCTNHGEVFEFNTVPINDVVHNFVYPPECTNILPIEAIIDEKQAPNYYDEQEYHTEAIFYQLDKRNIYSGNLAFRFDRAKGTLSYGTDYDYFVGMYDYEPNNFQAYVEQQVLKPWDYATIDRVVEEKSC